MQYYAHQVNLDAGNHSFMKGFFSYFGKKIPPLLHKISTKSSDRIGPMKTWCSVVPSDKALVEMEESPSDYKLMIL